MVNTFELMPCPNCPKRHYDGKRPNTLGKYKVYITSTNWIIFKCVRCNNVFKYKFVGSVLTKADMSLEELHQTR